MNRNIVYCLLLLPLVLASCANSYRIEGVSTLSHLEGKVIYLRAFRGTKWVAVDSSELVHGNFHMRGVADSAYMGTIFMDDVPILPIVVEPGKIEIAINDGELLVKGTKMNDELNRFLDRKKELESRQLELDREETRLILDEGDIEKAQQALYGKRDSLQNVASDHFKHFVQTHYRDVLGPTAFVIVCGNMPYPMLTKDIKDILLNAPESFKKNVMISLFVSQAEENMRILQKAKKEKEAQ